MPLPDELLALLRAPSTCYIATLMKDGSPQLTQVWVDTDGENVVINTVDTHVKRLREKLGAAGAYVETIRGVGYRLRAQPGGA